MGVTALERSWWQEGLVWPFFGPEVDPRSVRSFLTHCRPDKRGHGFQFTRGQATNILTDVTYLGWRTRKGELAKDAQGQPLIAHEPLINPDLFWWCSDRIRPERPVWAQAFTPARTLHALPRRRAARASTITATTVRFLAPGLVQCPAHHRPLTLNQAEVPKQGPAENLRCHLDERRVFDGEKRCLSVRTRVIESALCEGFVEQLTLDERDIEQLALIAERRTRGEGHAVAQLEQQLVDHRAAFEAAKQMKLKAPDLAEAYLDTMR